VFPDKISEVSSFVTPVSVFPDKISEVSSFVTSVSVFPDKITHQISLLLAHLKLLIQIQKNNLPRPVSSIFLSPTTPEDMLFFLSPTTPEDILFFLSPTTPEEILRNTLLKKYTLKLSKYLLAPLLSNVINESICDGVFLDNLKIAEVVSIFKSRAKFLLITDRCQFQHTFPKFVKEYCM